MTDASATQTPSTTSASEQLLGETALSDAVQDGVLWLESTATGWGLSSFWSGLFAAIVAMAIVGVVCWLGNLIAKALIKGVVHRLLKRTGATWAHSLMKERVLVRLSHLVPVALLMLALPAFSDFGVDWWLRPIVEIYVIWILLMVAFGLLEVGEDLVRHHGLEDRIPETGISQALKIVLSLIAVVLVFSVLFSKSPLWFLSGIGALAAVLMLIFKDAILGLVAGIQISINDMVRVGDWITVPSKGVDGDVEEITLTTVKVRAFDKTLVLVPAYDLMSNPFTNWRGMSESGGRRIKRSINIDLSTVRFVGRDDLDRYKRFSLLTEELDRRIAAVDQWNAENDVDTSNAVNGRQQTNLGVFRAYVEAYLRQHPLVHSDGFTFLVRHLDPGPQGLPLQIYVFTTDNRWVPYEQIQADIFDHLLAAVPGFDLGVFQAPSGRDVETALATAQ
ncbi:MAG: mechanosensitive ion channel family protein [Phycisphaerales bacterium]|nr:mechanosensitive ion channel family protein [Phycisphaerales bacterium]